MADLERTIEIIFAGTDSISGTLSTISGKMESFAGDLENIGAPFAAAADKVALLTAAVAGIAVAGIKASSDIEAEARKMQNSLGLPTAEAERFKDIAKEVYTGGYGETMAEAFETVTAAQKRFGDNAEVDIGKVTQQALALQKTFGTDYNEALGAVSTLMKNFGITSEEAFNFITKGFQDNLNGSGDFLESVNEYATQFQKAGADAGQFFSVLGSGFQEGVLGTDKAADMFKEFTLKIIDGSKSTNDALKSLGIDPVEFGKKMASGEMTAIQAFDTIQKKLGETTNKTTQFTVATALMGTPFEDLGTKAALAIDTTNTKLSEMKGAIEKIDTKTFEEKFVASLRTVTTAFGSMDQWDEAKDKIAGVFGDIAASFGPALDGVDFSSLEGKIAELWEKVANIFKGNDVDLTTTEGMQTAIQLVIDSVGTLTDVLSGMADIFDEVFLALKYTMDTVNGMPDGVKELAGQVIALGTALTGVATVVAVGGSLMSGFSALVGMVSTGGALMTGITGLVAVLSGPAGLAIAVGTVAAAVAGYTMSNMEEEHRANIKSIEAQTAKIKELTDQIDALPVGISTVEVYAAVEAGDLEKAKSMLDEIKTSDEYKARVSASLERGSFDKDLANVMKEVNSLSIIVDPDKPSVEETVDYIEYKVFKGEAGRGGQWETVKIPVESDGTEDVKEKISKVFTDSDGKNVWVPIETDADKAKKEIDEKIPTEKMLEIKLQGEIDTQIAMIESQAQTAQAAFEYTASVRIAEAQASAQVLESAFESVGNSVVSLSSGVSSMFGSLISEWNNLGGLAKSDFMGLLEDQQDTQNKMADAQIKLIDAQIKLMEEKARAMNNGDGLIKIDSTGLEPALETVMWQIIEKVQIRASEESADFLLGIS